MKFSGIFIIVAVSLSLFLSCSFSPEMKGDNAYNQAKGVQGELKLRKEKEAYVYYLEAIRKDPAKASVRLRNRFVEMTLNRAERFAVEGNADMDAIPRFIQDLDLAYSPEVSNDLKDRYAGFITQLADSAYAKKKLYKTLTLLDKAIAVAATKTAYEQRKKNITDNFAKENYEAAEVEMANGMTNKDNEALLRAEFFVQVTLMYEPRYPGADSLLGRLRRQTVGTYSAYPAVIQDKPDSIIWNVVNKYDIYLAVPKVTEVGNTVSMEASMYNYSCNPQRMKPSNFYIVDSKGTRYYAQPSSTFDREILDQEHETKMRLRFAKAGAPVKKLCFQSDTNDLPTKHYTEKIFF